MSNICASKAFFFFPLVHFNTNPTRLKYYRTFMKLHFPFSISRHFRSSMTAAAAAVAVDLFTVSRTILSLDVKTLDECSAHSSSADGPYPRSSVKRPCWRWLLGAFQTGFVPSPLPVTPPPAPPCPPAYSLAVCT